MAACSSSRLNMWWSSYVPHPSMWAAPSRCSCRATFCRRGLGVAGSAGVGVHRLLCRNRCRRELGAHTLHVYCSTLNQQGDAQPTACGARCDCAAPPPRACRCPLGRQMQLSALPTPEATIQHVQGRAAFNKASPPLACRCPLGRQPRRRAGGTAGSPPPPDPSVCSCLQRRYAVGGNAGWKRQCAEGYGASC